MNNEGGGIIQRLTRVIYVENCQYLSGPIPTSGGGIGGFGIGRSSQGMAVIKNCRCSVGLTNDGSGGILGRRTAETSGYVEIYDCEMEGDVSGMSSGGIVGSGACSGRGTMYISRCTTKGNLLSSASATGGIVGGADNSSTPQTIVIDSCVMEGNIGGNSSGGILATNQTNHNGTFHVSNCISLGDITGSSAGGICGARFGANNPDEPRCTVTNCSSTGIVRGFVSGGIVGRYARNADIVDCHSAGVMHIGQNMGGILGADSNNCTVVRCHSSGDIIGAGAGGIVGRRAFNLTVEDCYATGNMSGGASTGGIIGQDLQFVSFVRRCYHKGVIGGVGSGGICGSNCGFLSHSDVVIEDCYSLGDVIGNNAGGICGSLAGDGGMLSIINCYSMGNIEGFGSGGITGFLAGPSSGSTVNSCNIRGCYSAGTIAGEGAGGIIGRFSRRCNIDRCYTLGTIVGTKSGGITGEGPSSGAEPFYTNIRNCYTFGRVEGVNAGGIVGEVGSSTNGQTLVETCYSIGRVLSASSGSIAASVLVADRLTIDGCHHNGPSIVVGSQAASYTSSNSMLLFDNKNASSVSAYGFSEEYWMIPNDEFVQNILEVDGNDVLVSVTHSGILKSIHAPVEFYNGSDYDSEDLVLLPILQEFRVTPWVDSNDLYVEFYRKVDDEAIFLRQEVTAVELGDVPHLGGDGGGDAALGSESPVPRQRRVFGSSPYQGRNVTSDKSLFDSIGVSYPMARVSNSGKNSTSLVLYKNSKKYSQSLRQVTVSGTFQVPPIWMFT